MKKQSNKKSIKFNVREIQHPALIQYLKSRKVYMNKKIW